VFENRVLRKILGPERDEETGEWRRLLTEELSELHCSPNIVRVMKSRLRWTGHAACMGDRRGVYRILVGRPEGEIHLEDQSVDGRIAFRQGYYIYFFQCFRKCEKPNEITCQKCHEA